MKIDKDLSDSFWAIKALAIFSIFFAHMPGHSFNAVIFDRIGLIGVPLFMICAGFFYDRSRDKSLVAFLRKKWDTLIIPLLIWGTLTFMIHALKDQSVIGITSYVKWIVGIGTWLYFVPVLLCCQLFSRYINRSILLCLGLASMFFSYYGVIPYTEVFTPYVNPFNFIAYFVVGGFLRSYDKWMRISLTGGGILFVASALMIVLLKPVYWYPYSLIVSIVLFLSLFALFHHFNSKIIVGIGKLSFVIYLSHMQFAGAVNQLLKMLWGTPVEFVKTIVAFALVTILIWALQRLLIHFGFDSVKRYLGYR